MAAVATGLKAVLGDETMLMTVQNGMPWWYFQKHGVAYDGRRLETLDPDGTLEANIDPKHIVGCVVYPAAGVVEPGVIKHVEGDRFPIGELDGSETDRTQKLFDVLIGAGFRSRILDNIWSEIWLKAWGNLSFNPISSLTHATLEDICIFPETRLLAQHMMEEAQEVGQRSAGRCQQVQARRRLQDQGHQRQQAARPDEPRGVPEQRGRDPRRKERDPATA
jgi:ketopantoate reductase